jgi:hypothetical protein
MRIRRIFWRARTGVGSTGRNVSSGRFRSTRKGLPFTAFPPASARTSYVPASDASKDTTSLSPRLPTINKHAQKLSEEYDTRTGRRRSLKRAAGPQHLVKAHRCSAPRRPPSVACSETRSYVDSNNFSLSLSLHRFPTGVSAAVSRRSRSVAKSAPRPRFQT